MSKPAVKRGRGRPRVPDAVRKRNNVTIRVRDQVKRSLEAAAAENQRSLSEEIEYRLERADREEDLLPQLLAAVYGERLAALLTAMGRVMDKAATEAKALAMFSPIGGLEWVDQPHAFDQARKAAERILDCAAPDGDPTPRHFTISDGKGGKVPIEEIMAKGALGADMLVEQLEDRSWVDEDARWMEPLRKGLGDRVLARMVDKLEDGPAHRRKR